MNSKYKIKKYNYKCCGYEIEIYVDFKIPDNFYKCRECGKKIKLNMNEKDNPSAQDTD